MFSVRKAEEKFFRSVLRYKMFCTFGSFNNKSLFKTGYKATGQVGHHLEIVSVFPVEPQEYLPTPVSGLTHGGDLAFQFPGSKISYLSFHKQCLADGYSDDISLGGLFILFPVSPILKHKFCLSSFYPSEIEYLHTPGTDEIRLSYEVAFALLVKKIFIL